MSKKVENAFLTWKVKQDMDKEKYGSKWGANNVDKKEIKRAQIENREPHLYSVYPHKFRHTFVTRMNQSNISPFTVSKIAGHSSVNMTNYYTHLEKEYVSDEFNKFIETYEEENIPQIEENTTKDKYE